MAWVTAVRDEIRAWRERRSAQRELKALDRIDQWFLQLDENNPVTRTKNALAIGDKAAALSIWQEGLARHPTFARASRDAFRIEMALGRFDEAEAILKAGMRRSPSDPDYQAGFAWLAQERGDLEEAIARYSRFRRRFPSDRRGYVGGSACLRKAGRQEEADKLMNGAVKSSPHDAALLIEWANVAEERHDFEVALTRWETVCDRTRHVAGEFGVARMLRELGRFDEAEHRLQAARSARPQMTEFGIALATLAEARAQAQRSCSGTEPALQPSGTDRSA